MLPGITVENLREWSKGQLSRSCSETVLRLSTDSRTLQPGDVFLALRGENFDGHDFLDKAEQAGALAVICETAPRLNLPVLQVPDTTQAMMRIAAGVRGRFTGPVFALTGSAGKSSTKEMLGTLLGEHTWISPASFNNRIGVSKTLFELQPHHQKLVLEMGMNALGEIAEMCEFARPGLGLITNIGDAHMGKVGGLEGVYRAKKELFDFLAGHGTAVAVNLEDPKVVRAYEAAFQGTQVQALKFSGLGGEGADVAVTQARLDPRTGELALECRLGTETFSSRVPLFGIHHRENVAAAMAGARLMGASPAEIQSRLPGLRPAPHRGEVHSLSGDRLLVDEAYNSNPTALKASLESVFRLRPGKPRLLILGEMLEMGEFTERVHREAGEAIARLADGPVQVLGVGPASRFLLEGVGASAQCQHLDKVEQALPLVPALAEQAEVVFVKGSRGNRLEKIVEILRK